MCCIGNVEIQIEIEKSCLNQSSVTGAVHADFSILQIELAYCRYRNRRPFVREKHKIVILCMFNFSLTERPTVDLAFYISSVHQGEKGFKFLLETSEGFCGLW